MICHHTRLPAIQGSCDVPHVVSTESGVERDCQLSLLNRSISWLTSGQRKGSVRVAATPQLRRPCSVTLEGGTYPGAVVAHHVVTCQSHLTVVGLPRVEWELRGCPSIDFLHKLRAGSLVGVHKCCGF